MIHLSYYVDQIYTLTLEHGNIQTVSREQKQTLVEYLNNLEGDNCQIVSVAPFCMDGSWIYYLITWRDAPV
jgi:hypothetical protein